MNAITKIQEGEGQASLAYFTFVNWGRKASQLVIDSDRMLSIRLMNGEAIEAEIHLGPATAETFKEFRTRLHEIEALIKSIN